MKKLILLPIILLATLVAHAQTIPSFTWTFDDDDTSYNNHFVIDTVNYHHNVWEIGRPSKPGFDSAFSTPNAIVTDTLNPYAANDTSVFYIKFPLHIGIDWPKFISFHYKLNTDSADFAFIDISADSGLNWNRLAQDDYHTTNGYLALLHQTLAWDSTSFNLEPGAAVTTDTYILRFTFITANNDSSKAGWMMDDFYIEYWSSGVPKINKNNIVQIYPNPSKGDVFIKDLTNARKADIAVYSIDGKLVYSKVGIATNKIIHLPVPAGQYIIKYKTDKGEAARVLTIDK